jgi:hypothetical protein
MTRANSGQPGVHIADIDFDEFYSPVFGTKELAEAFHRELQSLSPPDNAPLVAYHQAARMIWLGDKIETVALGRPAFQILVLLVAAELVAKMVFNFAAEGESRKYVQRFFGEICAPKHRQLLADAFFRPQGNLTAQQAVDLLYKLRCDVVHRGQYYTFSLRAGSFPMMTGVENISTNITLADLRRVVLEGAVLGCQRMLKERRPMRNRADA